jgi:hypothetical protein
LIFNLRNNQEMGGEEYMKNNYIVTAILVLIVGAATFYGGMQYQKSQRGQFAGQFGGNRGQGGQFGRGVKGGGMVLGQVMSKDDKSITVKLQDGSSKIVILSGSTTINKQATGTKDDLNSGERVAVFGTTNSDGSVTAQSIQLNPQVRMFRGGPTPTP